MNVAVLSLTRDRLDYTKHCFAKLEQYAGCDFDHYVLDQGSTDGTAECLRNEYVPYWLETVPANIGISRGLNNLLDALDTGYDVVVKFDNDCELIQPDTLAIICELVAARDAFLSPRILGLENPPATWQPLYINGQEILPTPQIGGIFLAAPGWVYDEFRYSETNPSWGGDDVEICAWWRDQGGTCGYVKRLEAWHYLGTRGQHRDIPAYFERTLAEGKPAL